MHCVVYFFIALQHLKHTQTLMFIYYSLKYYNLFIFICFSGNEGESFDKIFEGCETCGSRLKTEQDSNTSHPNR